MTRTYSRLSLRIFGDDLVPEAVSGLLGMPPSSSFRKGELKASISGKELRRKTSGWFRDATVRETEDINSQIAEILDALSQDPTVWTQLRERFQLDLHAGIFFSSDYPGFTLEQRSVELMASRGLLLHISLYILDGPE
jgi:hypothetical protein